MTNNRSHKQTDDKSLRYVILVTDMLYDFIYGKLKSRRAKTIIPNISTILDQARKNKIPIIYCNDEHKPSDPELFLWGAHAMKGTKGSEVIKELRPKAKDNIVTKTAYSAFDGGGLDKILRKSYRGKGATSLIMTGIHTHICIKHSVYDAFVRGYDTIIATDAVNAFTRRDHLYGLKYMKRHYNSKIMNIASIIDMMDDFGNHN
jgi:nicotinamidase-related amidase